MINNLLHKLVHPAERLSRVACNRRVTVLILRYGRSGWKNFSADFKVRSLSRYRSVVNTYDTIHQQNVVSVAYVAQSSLLAQEAGGFFCSKQTGSACAPIKQESFSVAFWYVIQFDSLPTIFQSCESLAIHSPFYFPKVQNDLVLLSLVCN